jgi:subtilisin family serine protease
MFTHLRTLPIVLGLVAGASFILSLPVSASSSPNDPYFTNGSQWYLNGLNGIAAPQAWCVSTGSGILIADIDSGADFSHPDLQGQLIPGVAYLGHLGLQTGSGINALIDDANHGTETAGILAAQANNNEGISGIAPNAKVLVIKVADSQGGVSQLDEAAGIRYAVDHGAKVLNLSLPPVGLEKGGAIYNSMQYALSKGAMPVIAADNFSADWSVGGNVEKTSHQILVVGATGIDGAITSYSGRGAGVNVYAPGGELQNVPQSDSIISTASLKTGYAYNYEAGTSEATPMVSGVMALLMAKGYSASEARYRLLSSTVSKNGLPTLNAARALGSTAQCPLSGYTQPFWNQTVEFLGLYNLPSLDTLDLPSINLSNLFLFFDFSTFLFCTTLLARSYLVPYLEKRKVTFIGITQPVEVKEV